MCIWDFNDDVKYTDTSTVDLGSTVDIEFEVANNSGIIELKAIVANGSWDVKTGIRII
jgi:hypothetical protein